MIDLFFQGGFLTMSILTLLLVAVVITSFKKSELTKSLGLLACIVGLLSAILGLYSAFNVIEQVGNIAPSILAGGIKTAFTNLIYGLIIYMISTVLDIIRKWKG